MSSLKTDKIEFPSNSHATPAYLATPDDGVPHAAVVVIQEWWGVVPHIKEVADRFAREGITALAPDLYHGKVAAEPDEAKKLAMGHAFFNDTRPGIYRADAALDAWGKTLAWLRKYLG